MARVGPLPRIGFERLKEKCLHHLSWKDVSEARAPLHPPALILRVGRVKMRMQNSMCHQRASRGLSNIKAGGCRGDAPSMARAAQVVQTFFLQQ